MSILLSAAPVYDCIEHSTQQPDSRYTYIVLYRLISEPKYGIGGCDITCVELKLELSACICLHNCFVHNKINRFAQCIHSLAAGKRAFERETGAMMCSVISCDT